MRCTACNKALSDKESVFKDSRGEYADMCFECLQYVYDGLNESDFEDNDPIDKEENL